MFCSPTGRTIEIPGSVTIHDLIAEELKETVANRKPLSKDEAVNVVKGILNISDVQCSTYRQLRDRRENVCFSRYGLEVDNSMVTTMFCASKNAYFKLAPEASVELYVPHQDCVAELDSRCVSEKQELFGIDYRGVGESTPDGCDQDKVRDFFANYKYDYHYASLSLLMGESYLGDRVRDILGAIDLLSANGAKNIKLTCSGIGRIPALFAALLTPHNVCYMPDLPLASLECQVWDAEGSIPQSMIPVGLLKYTDFPELEKLVK